MSITSGGQDVSGAVSSMPAEAEELLHDLTGCVRQITPRRISRQLSIT